MTIAIKRKKFIDLNGYPILRTAEDWLFMGKVIKNNLNLYCVNKVLVEIKKDQLFISRRSGKNVYEDIIYCLNELFKLGLMNKYQKFISTNIQRILRLYTPTRILKIIFLILRKNVN